MPKKARAFDDGGAFVCGSELESGSELKKKKGRVNRFTRPFRNNPGGDLLSHTVTHAVPSAVAGLTSVFGMGTGVTLPL